MRLVYLVQYFFPEQASGLQLVEDLLEGFAMHGWKIDVYTPTPTRGVTEEQRKEYKKKRVESRFAGNLVIHRMPLYREGKNFIGRAIRYIIFSIECFWKAVTVPADFIFTGSGPPTQGIIVGLAKKVSGKKVIYNLQDIFPDSLVTSGICGENSVLMKIGHAMENFTYRNADHIITITDDMKVNIMKKGVPEEKIISTINALMENEVLLSNLRAPANCENGLEYVLKILAPIEGIDRQKETLQKINTLINQMNGELEIDQVNAKTIESVYTLMDGLLSQKNEKDLLAVNKGMVLQQNKLPYQVKEIVEQFVEALTYLQVDVPSRLEKFKRQFQEEYGSNVCLFFLQKSQATYKFGTPYTKNDCRVSKK